MAAVAAELGARGGTIDRGSDPAGSGLIGLEWSGITTTLGNLPAKRSAAQPASAALLLRLLREAGVGEGDVVAVDSSGSFPGFAIATLLAAESLGARTLCIASVGSSTWGANRPEFALPDILWFLADRGILANGPAVVSPGGADDLGKDMDPDLVAAILERAASHGSTVLRVVGLEADIVARQSFFAKAAGGRRPAVFVSIGGNLPSTGPGDVLAGRSGLLRAADFADGRVPGRGLVQEFLAEGLPVIRLIDVKDLAARYGLPWDPEPWPSDPGLPPETTAFDRGVALTAVLAAFATAALGGRIQRRRASAALRGQASRSVRSDASAGARRENR